CHADRVAQAAGEDTALAACKIELVDRSPAFLDLHAHFADVAERADPRIELAPVTACQQASRPVPAGLERHELASRRRDAVGIRRVWERHHAVAAADIECI